MRVAVIQISLRVKGGMVLRSLMLEMGLDGPYVKNKESGIDEPIHPSEKKIVMIQSRRRHRFKTSHPVP